jgi:hypothetical protein
MNTTQNAKWRLRCGCGHAINPCVAFMNKVICWLYSVWQLCQFWQQTQYFTKAAKAGQFMM